MTIDFYSLTLEEIEKYLNIKKVKDKESLPSHIETSTFDDFESVEDFLNQFKGTLDLFTVYGYELVHDNHYIKLYYTHKVSFT